MAQLQSQSVSREKFLLMATNLLHRHFFDAARTDAKRSYRELEEGGTVHLARVEMEDKSLADFLLSLDHSEFRGRLNYGAFRASLGMLLGNLSNQLREEKEVSVFNEGDNADNVIFGVSGLTVEDDQPNVLVLGADTGGQAGVKLRLMYLDPGQFQGNDDPGVSR